MRKTIIWNGTVALMCLSASAVPSFKTNLGDADARMATYLVGFGNLRDAAVASASTAVSRQFSLSAQTKWNVDIAAEMEDPMLADFFRGAIVLPGPETPEGGIGGFYNPWWDALLVMRLKPVENAAGASFVVTEFHLLSGETFRGERVDANPLNIAARTIIPEKDPLSVELWRVVSGTRKRFEQAFPIDGKIVWGKFSATLLSIDRKREMQRIIARGALRLRLYQALLHDPSAIGKSKVFENLVRTAGHYQLFTYFRDPNCFGVMKTLSEMPAAFRKDFTAYGYVRTGEGAQYLYVNVKVPRLYAIVSVPKDVKKNPASLEWFDLAQADDLLRVWNACGKEEK